MSRIVVVVVMLGLLLGHCLAGVKPNVIVVMPDDLGHDDFSFFNQKGPRTPNLDTLAREGVRLTDFHVAPSCAPTRAAVMTGRHCDAAGVWHTILGRYFLRTNEVTMAEVFKANGYGTALIGKWHLGDHYPFRPKDRGFEHVVMLKGGGIDQQQNPWRNRNTPPCTVFENDRPVLLTATNGALTGAPAAGADSEAFLANYFTTEAIRYMQGCQARRAPFFVYLPYNVAHSPHDLPPDARAGVDARTATIENLDKNIGRLFDFLGGAGLADNTLLVFFTDNGMASDLWREGKASEYEGGHRVPCFIRWPAGRYGGTQAAAREMPRLASAMDLLPTLMDVLGLHDVPHRSPEVPLAGRSLKTLLDADPTNDDHPPQDRVLIVDNQREDDLVKYKQACVMRDDLDGKGVVLHKWRLIRPSAARPWELYDVQSDPGQKTNRMGHARAGFLQQVVHDLQAAYEVWWREVSVNARDYSRPVLGADAEPVSCLYAHDWHMAEGMPPWNQTMVAAGDAANGFHAVAFAGAGDYTFDLRRWPCEIESETSVDSALRLSLRSATDNSGIVGRALPVRSARIRVWNGPQTYGDERQTVSPGSSGPVFTMRLPAGPAMVKTWFYDASGRELCGAYYVYVIKRKKGF